MTLRVLSTVLLVAGVALVFAGITAALGVSVPGLLATAAAVGGLLYAGAVWFGGRPPAEATAIVFTRELIVAVGDGRGRSLSDVLPEDVRGDVIARCRAAIEGRGGAFLAAGDRAGRTFDVAPIRGEDGGIVCGLLLVGGKLPRPVTREPLTLAL